MRLTRGHRPGFATPLAVRQVTPLNSHPAALPGRLVDIALTCPPVADYQVQPGGRCLRRVHRTGYVITCPVTYLILSCSRCLCYHACGSLRPHNAAVRRPVLLWRRQPLTSRGPLASLRRHHRARAATGYIPRPTTPRCALLGRLPRSTVTRAALPGRSHRSLWRRRPLTGHQLLSVSRSLSWLLARVAQSAGEQALPALQS